MTDPAILARNAVVEANLGLVRFFNRRHRTRRGWVDWEDIDQEGCLGLIRAVEKFDRDKGTLSTYSKRWVRLFAGEAAFSARYPYRVTWRQRNGPIAPKAASVPLEALPARDDRSDHLDRLDALWAAVEALREPDRSVIRLRYGEGLLFRQIGDRLGYTRERVRQIAARGVRRLRDVLGEAG